MIKFNCKDMNISAISDAFYQEFSCYYNADELPLDWINNIEVYAKDSANRLLKSIPREILIEILLIIIQDRFNDINIVASNASNIDWTSDDNEWHEYKLLLTKIYENVLHTRYAK
ncbi:MAG: hypothetical protein ACFN9G_03585 [Cardiobacterium sp.]|jgi:hypothetical protein